MLCKRLLRQVFFTVSSTSSPSLQPFCLFSLFRVNQAVVISVARLSVQSRSQSTTLTSNPTTTTVMTPGIKCQDGLKKRLLATSCIMENKKGSVVSSVQILAGKPKLIDKNLSLWTSISAPASSKTSSLGTKSESGVEVEESKPKKLLILFAYMLPQERHLEKYRSIYFQHGFDVLTVKTSPFEFFFPSIGAQKVADAILSFMKNKSTEYPEVIVHAFSVGGYQFAEFLNKLYDSGNGQATQQILKRSIKGTIFDSPCDVDSVPYGLSRTVAGDTVFARILETLVNLTRSIFYPVSTKYHIDGMVTFFNKPLPCPSLFFASKCDKMANIQVIEEVVKTWIDKGCDVSLKTWDDTRHVSHYHAHPKEYMNDVQDFLKKINII